MYASGPPGIPIETFEDVITEDYRVTTYSDYYKSMLKSAKPGTAKRTVYNTRFKDKEDSTGVGLVESLESLEMDPKMLLYCGPYFILPHLPNGEIMNQLVVLKMKDVTFWSVTLPLHKGSEFLEIFNHYILKGKETGFLDWLHRRYYVDLFTKENFELKEPQSLAFNNVMFCFSFIAMGVCSSVAIAIVEHLMNMCKIKRASAKGWNSGHGWASSK